jgi:quinol monooxygenase YgiN
MITTGLLVTLEAKPGREADIEAFLKDARPLVDAESDTAAWFGIRLGPTTFGIVDFFPDEDARQAHLRGQVAQALMERAPELFSEDPVIIGLDVVASKLPAGSQAGVAARS